MEARAEGVLLTTQSEVEAVMPYTGREQGTDGWGKVPLAITGKEASLAFNAIDQQARNEAYRACDPETAASTQRYYRELAQDLGFCVLRSARLRPETPTHTPLHVAA